MIGRQYQAQNVQYVQRPKWEEKKDPRSGRLYYANFETRKTQWVKPVDFGAMINVPVQPNSIPVPQTSRSRSGGSNQMPVQQQQGRAKIVQTEFKEKPKIKAYANRAEKKILDDQADIYSIIIATEHLEKAFVRDAITDDVYTKSCKKLIAQYKTASESMGNSWPGLMEFMKNYNLKTQSAAVRFQQGVPATIYHGGSQSQEEKGAELNVFHAVQHFITLMDSLKLEMKAVDELHPSLSDLMESINKVSNLPPDHDSKTKVKKWLVQLNSMKASDELSDDEVRQMSMDLEIAYTAFHKFIEGKK